MATIHAVPLEYADMSSVPRWATSVRSIIFRPGTEIGICDCRCVVPGFFVVEPGARDPEFAFEQELTVPGWCELRDQPVSLSVFGLGVRPAHEHFFARRHEN